MRAAAVGRRDCCHFRNVIACGEMPQTTSGGSYSTDHTESDHTHTRACTMHVHAKWGQLQCKSHQIGPYTYTCLYNARTRQVGAVTVQITQSRTIHIHVPVQCTYTPSGGSYSADHTESDQTHTRACTMHVHAKWGHLQCRTH